MLQCIGGFGLGKYTHTPGIRVYILLYRVYPLKHTAAVQAYYFTSFQAMAPPLLFCFALSHLSQLIIGKPGAGSATAARTASRAQDSDAEEPECKALEW